MGENKKNKSKTKSIIICIVLVIALVSVALVTTDRMVDDKKSPTKNEETLAVDNQVTEGTTTMLLEYDSCFAGDGEIYYTGLDLSSWQKDAVDFDVVKAMGYNYVILRLGTSEGKDSCFDEFYSAAKNAGLYIGAYFFSYAATQEEIQEDISNCKEWLGDSVLDFPFYLDYEDSSLEDLPSEALLENINTFLSAFTEEGYLMGIYSLDTWITQDWLVSSSVPQEYEGWISLYDGDGTYDAGYGKYGAEFSTKYGMYQYTNKHCFTYEGVQYGPYDANICYKDYPTIIKEIGFNGYNDLKDGETGESWY